MNIFLFGLIFLFALNNSCRKEKKEDTTKEFQEASKDIAISENFFNDLKKQAIYYLKKAEDSLKIGSFIFDSITECPTITIFPFNSTTWPKTIIIDFGNTNCMCNDGRFRRGKINITATGFYRDSGTVITIIPEDYYVNNYKIEGNKVITNLGRNQEGNLKYSIITEGKITFTDGTSRKWNSQRFNLWLSGENTFNPFDDEYEVTGTANGITRNNKNFSLTIVNPLNIYTGCKWIRSGSVSLFIENYNPIYVNYGNEKICDNQIIVTINNQNYIINISN